MCTNCALHTVHNSPITRSFECDPCQVLFTNIIYLTIIISLKTKMSHSVQIVDLVPLKEESLYLKPLRLNYKQNGKSLTWDCIKVHDSVAILLYNTSRNVLVFVRQFRPPVYLSTLLKNSPTSLDKLSEASKNLDGNFGYTIELCAGIIDKKGLTPQEIAREEIIEETGYNPPMEKVHLITTYRTDVGTAGSLQYLFYCEVNDSMRVNSGGGVEDESIEVIECSIEESKKHMLESDGFSGMGRTPGFRFALSWFIYDKLPSLANK